MPSARMVGLGITALIGVARVAHPQPQAPTWSVMGQAVPLVTRGGPTATQPTHLEGYLAQPMIMARGAGRWWSLDATLNLEGLTLTRGELTLGAQGEGYIDRRHPHAYLHEAILGVERQFASIASSLSAGRGFVPFGSDDPMVRPFAKYPANHHLAQMPERLVLIGAVARRALTFEGATFGGDEPTSPGSSPRLERFGDSWAARATVRPRTSIEMSASVARVRSPESALGDGLDHDKTSFVLRVDRPSVHWSRHALIEWVQTVEHDESVRSRYTSFLAEASVCRAGITGALRGERTERPEEERTSDPYRTPRPANHHSTLGTTRWSTYTGSVSTAARAGWPVRVSPFVEVSAARVKRLDDRALFDPSVMYGRGWLWLGSIGARLQLGHAHDRMGQYGAARRTVASAMAGHDMAGHDMASMSHAAPGRDGCSA
jgi:hypothetical protein